MMNEKTATELGMKFTGMCWNINDSEMEDYYKKEAKRIKKAFNEADCRVVTGTATSLLGKGNKGIWGNDIFIKVMNYDLTNSLVAKLKLIEEKRKWILKELEELEKEVERAKEFDQDVRSLLKVKDEI